MQFDIHPKSFSFTIAIFNVILFRYFVLYCKNIQIKKTIQGHLLEVSDFKSIYGALDELLKQGTKV
jgi:hypothetical protein